MSNKGVLGIKKINHNYIYLVLSLTEVSAVIYTLRKSSSALKHYYFLLEIRNMFCAFPSHFLTWAIRILRGTWQLSALFLIFDYEILEEVLPCMYRVYIHATQRQFLKKKSRQAIAGILFSIYNPYMLQYLPGSTSFIIYFIFLFFGEPN